MRTKVWIVTNNPMVEDKYPNAHVVDGDFLCVLTEVRDMVHRGYALISHPLAGSVKPRETEYKSILVAKSSEALDMKSLDLIENAIESTKKFHALQRDWKDPARVDRDFQTIDFSLIEEGLDSLNPTVYHVVE